MPLLETLHDAVFEPVYAVTTSTIITNVGTGIDQGSDAITDMVGNNIAGLLTIGGLIIGIYLVWKLLRRMAR